MSDIAKHENNFHGQDYLSDDLTVVKLVPIDSRAQRESINALSVVIHAIDQKLETARHRIPLYEAKQKAFGLIPVPERYLAKKEIKLINPFIEDSLSYKWYESKAQLEVMLKSFPYITDDSNSESYRLKIVLEKYIRQEIDSVMKDDYSKHKKYWDRVLDLVKYCQYSSLRNVSVNYGLIDKPVPDNYDNNLYAAGVVFGKIALSEKQYRKSVGEEISLVEKAKRNLKEIVINIPQDNLAVINAVSQVTSMLFVPIFAVGLVTNNLNALIGGTLGLFSCLAVMVGSGAMHDRGSKIISGEVVSTKIHENKQISASKITPLGFTSAVSHIMSFVNKRQDDMTKRIELICKRAEKLHENEFLDAQTQASIDSLFNQKLIPSVETYIKAASFAPTPQDLRWVKDTFAVQLDEIDTEITRINKEVFAQRKEEMQIQSIYLTSPKQSDSLKISKNEN